MENAQISVPHGEEKITIELTVKEAIALTGVKFNQDPQQSHLARKKIRQSLDKLMKTNSERIQFHTLH